MLDFGLKIIVSATPQSARVINVFLVICDYPIIDNLKSIFYSNSLKRNFTQINRFVVDVFDNDIVALFRWGAGTWGR